MSTVTHIYDAIDRLAPFWLTMDFDNTGILVGDRNREVSCALLALDCTPAVVEQARQLGAQLIITHHPVIFHPLKRVNEDAVVYQLIRSDIAVISAHTNLDIAQGGVNDALASAIGLRDCRGLELLNEQTAAPRAIHTVALCSGSGADCLDAAISAGADALLTSEVKQHEYLAATAAGISIFDAGHFDTEDIVIEPLRDYLAKEIPDVHFFTTHRSAIQAI